MSVSLGFQKPLQVTGNGYVVHVNGQLVGRPMVSTSPAMLDHPDGISGQTHLKVRPPNHPLFSADGLDGSEVADTPIPLFGADRYQVRRIVVFAPSSVPTDFRFGLYTRTGGEGREVHDGSADLSVLTNDKLALEIPVDLGVIMRAPHLYFRPTVPEALTLSLRVYGDVIDPLPG